MIVKIHKNAEDDDGDNDKPLEHIRQHDKRAGYGQQQYPADMERAQLVIVLVNVVQQRVCAAFVDVPGI